MKRTIIAVATIGMLICTSASFAQADWFNYVVRTSGLGWSDGYHAYDQCPPCKRGHSTARHAHAFPAWGAAQEAHAPYYFEEPGYKAEPPPEQLPSAPPDAAESRIPSPQARYQPRSRYFQALQTEQQLQQARVPQHTPPF